MRTRAWSRLSGDDGFTLLELSVAMIIIAVVVTTLVALQVSSMKTVALARQRQAATALADQKLERLRALPYSTIQAGLLKSDSTLAADTTHVSMVSGVPTQLTAPWNESLVVSGSQSEPELVPHTQTTTLNGINYSVSVYITHPTDDVNSAVDFWLTVITKWTSGSTSANGKQVVVRTRASYPTGCKGLGTANHPYAGPCQPFLYGNAGRTGAQITISPADPNSTSPIANIPFTSASVVFTDYSAQIGVEQTTSAITKAINSGTNIDGTVTDENNTTATADVDPGTSTTTGPFNTSVPSTSASSSQISGSGGVLTLDRTGVASGSAIQAAVAANTAGNCQDLAGTVFDTNQACSAAQLGRAGTNDALLDLPTIGGRDLPAFTLASMRPADTVARAYTARLQLPANGHCTGTTGDGCAAAGAQRGVASLVVGALPPADDGDTVPSGFSGMVTSNGLTESANSEVGQGASAGTTLTNGSAARTGSLSYWNGNGYASLDLTSATSAGTYTLPPVNATYWRNGSPQITIAMNGVLKVPATSYTTSTPAGCQPTACTVKASSGAIIADVTYTISSGGNPLAYFTVELNLGSVLANTTYRAVPSA